MPLTQNIYTAADTAGPWEDVYNWSLGHNPTASEEAVVNVDEYFFAPATVETTQTIGELSVNDGTNGDNLGYGNLSVLGDVQITESYGQLEIGYIGGTFTGDGTLQYLQVDVLDGALTYSEALASGGCWLGVSGGSGTITFDVSPDGLATTLLSGFNGTVNNTSGSPVDLQDSALGGDAILLPNNAAFTNFTGGAAPASGVGVGGGFRALSASFGQSFPG